MNKKILTLASSALALSVVPLIALAQINPGSTPTSNGSLNVTAIINAVLNFAWPVFIGLAVIMFLYAGILFLTSSGDASKVASARNAVLWGAVGVIVGILAFSLPFIIRNTLGVG